MFGSKNHKTKVHNFNVKFPTVVLEDPCVMNWGIDTRCLIFDILLLLLFFLCLKHNALFSRIVLHFAFPSLGPDCTNVEKEASL